MPAILEIPEFRRLVSPILVADYHRLGEFNKHGRRTQLIRGIIIEKRSKSPLHRSVCSRLFKFILAHCPSIPDLRVPLAEIFG